MIHLAKVANGLCICFLLRRRTCVRALSQWELATSSIPVMFLTVKSDKESVMKVVSLKPEKYLLKTMPPDELIANIDEFFEKKKVSEFNKLQ